MLGAIIGDIVGSRWEFNPSNDYNFEWLSQENGFTDDSICTVAVADALLHERDFGESIHDWCNRYPNPKGGYGGRFAQWVHSDNPQAYGSYGNGSAMRVSPVGWFPFSREEVLEVAKKTAICTHSHPEGVKGAQTVALAIFTALQQRAHGAKAREVVEVVLKDCLEFSGYSIDIRKEDVINRFDETCQGTVPVALWIIKQSKGFEDAVRRAVSLGADADTLGAIVGSIAEAIWGIPSKIRHQIEQYIPTEMISVIREFHHARPESYKPLIDTCFSGNDFGDVSWEILYDVDGKDVYDEIRKKTENEHEQKRMLMAERAKAREIW